MYRDDPLDDEFELREIVGDPGVDALLGGDEDALGTALDILRVLQGWVDDEAAGRWFHQPQRRLEGATPLEALADGDLEDVQDAAAAWAAAQG